MPTLTAGSAVFVDTNVLIYATFPETAFYAIARARLRDLRESLILLWTSRQVLREFVAATTRPGNFAPCPSTAAVCNAVREFEGKFEVAGEDAGVTARLLDLLSTGGVKGRQVHDANIVATMLLHDIAFLLTHNTKDFARYAPSIKVLPLTDRSPEVLN